MFEAPQEQKQSSASKMWLATVVVVAATAGVGTWWYTGSKAGGKVPAAAVSGAAPFGNADAAHDLKILSARMEKDHTGTIAMWLVDVSNKSKSYTYSSIDYETTYVGANNAAIAVNKGTIAISIVPGDEKTIQVRDVLYPVGTQWYKFRVTGAKSKVE